jgi:hypothetical protein
MPTRTERPALRGPYRMPYGLPYHWAEETSDLPAAVEALIDHGAGIRPAPPSEAQVRLICQILKRSLWPVWLSASTRYNPAQPGIARRVRQMMGARRAIV